MSTFEKLAYKYGWLCACVVVPLRASASTTTQQLTVSMGKRKKSSKPPPKKKRPVLAKTFDCPFCDHSGSCSCELKRDQMIGKIECSVCNASFSTQINNLSEAIDVYSDWIDACVRVNPREEEELEEDAT